MDQEPPSKEVKTGLGMLLSDMFNKPAEKKCMLVREKAEQEMHIQEASPSVDVNVVQEWKHNCNCFPANSGIVRKHLCVPATSTPSEKLFSKPRCIISSESTAWDPENASMLCFLG